MQPPDFVTALLTPACFGWAQRSCAIPVQYRSVTLLKSNRFIQIQQDAHGRRPCGKFLRIFP